MALRLLTFITVVCFLRLSAAGDDAPEGSAPSAEPSPLPLSAVFTAPRAGNPGVGTSSAAVAGAEEPLSPPILEHGPEPDGAIRLPTPFRVDPRCPPSNIPPLALLPTPTPVPTPRPTPIPLPEGMTAADLYAPPGHMGRRREEKSFLDPKPGLLADRSTDLAEIDIENQWKQLCASVTFVPSEAEADDSTNQILSEPEGETGTRGPVTALYLPGQSDRFRLPAGEWRVVLRAWEPAPPYPERTFEFPIEGLTRRRGYEAILSSDLETSILKETHPIVVETRERSARTNPLNNLGKPPPTPEDLTIRLGRIGTP